MASDYPFDLGPYRRPVTAQNTAAQTWFHRGLVWTYSFNHEEAASCFEKAVAADATCAMAHWGLAYCLGPNYNKPWSFFDEKDLADVVRRGHCAAKLALNNLSGKTPVEAALVKAVQHRYPEGEPSGRCDTWSEAFADAMGEVYREFPDDLDVVTVYADSLMNLKPWELWDLKTGEPTEGAPTLKIKSVIDRALTLDGALRHPGLIHMYIHLMEMSPNPAAALPIADHLRGLVPDGGHLHHMPTHLDVLCGRYQAAIESNSAAVAADERYLSVAGPLNFYTLYRAHNHHFRVYAAMFAGQLAVCLDSVARLEASLPRELLVVESPPMADWLESFLTLRAHVLIRFGRWEEILALSFPEDRGLYCTTTAVLHYAKAIAFAVTGSLREAEMQQQEFRAAARNVKGSRTLFNNTCTDILRVAEAMMDGEVEYRHGNYDVAFEHLREAIRREDSLPYDEPWGWMQPTRHAYGALLLEQGRVEEATKVYMADLGMNDELPRALRHPGNIWALHGVHECLLKLGKENEARDIEEELDMARKGADVPVRASCFCRLKTCCSQDS